MRRGRSVILIGNFDGVHLGHAELLRRARRVAQQHGPDVRVVAMSFHPHPMSLLRPGTEPPLLTEFARRRALLVEAGADEVVHLTPSPDVLSLTPEDFIARVMDEHHPVAFVEGEDFRFGRNRAGDIGTLQSIGRKQGFNVVVVEAVDAFLSDHTATRVSSTMVRWLLARGRVGDAARLLGRAHEIEGTVVRGDRRGRGLGFPTANVDTHVMVPADGVYAATAELPDGRIMSAALSIGVKPTFQGAARTVEAHLLRDGDSGEAWAPLPGLPEYAWPIRLRVLAWVRDQVKFPSVHDLLDQLRRDCQRVSELAAATMAQQVEQPGSPVR